MARPPSATDRGQAAIFTIILLTTLAGMVALVIDVGGWRETRSHMINAADAAALAGASQLPDSPARAISVAQLTATRNGASSSTVTVATNTVTVTVTAPGQPYFARIFGIGGFPIHATAVAEAQSYTSFSGTPMLPIAVMESDLPDFGTRETIKQGGGGGTTGNYGAIDLPSQQQGCSAGSGSSYWGALVAGTDTPCDVQVGDTVSTETGNMAGPTDQGLTDRIGNNTQTFSDVVQADPNGGPATIIDPTSPRLVVVPIVVNVDGSSDWPTGRADVEIVGFAYYFIESWDQGAITGTFIKAVTDLPDEQTGDPIPGSGLQHVKLIQ